MFKQILRSTTIIGKLTLLSRLLGYLRDMLIARLFGASFATDAFFIAFKIPNLFRRFFAEGAFSNAFIPVLTEYKEKHDRKSLSEFLNAQFGALSTVLGLVVTIGILISPFVIMVFAPGFERESDRYLLSVELLKITFPYLVFISLTALLASVLNVFGKFAIPAFTPALLNISIITVAIFLSPLLSEPIYSLAIGVFIGGILQLALQYLSVRKLGLHLTLNLGFKHDGVKRVFKHDGVKRVFKLMIPGIIGGSVAQLNILIDSIIASFLVAGSISWLYYSDRIIELPLGIFGIALATAILPSLSKLAINSEFKKFNNAVRHSINWALFLSIPSASGIILLAEPIIISLFHYGEMTTNDVQQCIKSLRAYAIGLPAFILIKVLVTTYFATKDMVTPVKIAVIALVVNTILNLFLMQYFGHTGLALATSIAAWLNASLLFIFLKTSEGKFTKEGVFNCLRILIASVIMLTVLSWSIPNTTFNVEIAFWLRFFYLFCLIVIGCISYLIVSIVLGMNKGKIHRLYGI